MSCLIYGLRKARWSLVTVISRSQRRCTSFFLLAGLLSVHQAPVSKGAKACRKQRENKHKENNTKTKTKHKPKNHKNQTNRKHTEEMHFRMMWLVQKFLKVRSWFSLLLKMESCRWHCLEACQWACGVRAGCTFHGLSSSGSKGDVFREWLIIRRSWNWASKADGEEPGEDTGYSGAHHGLQPNLMMACGALRGKGQLDLMNRKTSIQKLSSDVTTNQKFCSCNAWQPRPGRTWA